MDVIKEPVLKSYLDTSNPQKFLKGELIQKTFKVRQVQIYNEYKKK